MNKIFYTLIFILSLSFFNNEAKAQSSDISACTLISGAVDVADLADNEDKTCDTTGATKLTLKLHNLGFCTSAPTIKFATGGKEKDERDFDGDYLEGTNSDFSSCTWTIKQTTATDEILETVGEVEPLPLDELPPKGTYTHAVIVVSNVVKVQGFTQFDTAIADTTTPAGNSGTYCWTNGAQILEIGRDGPRITPPLGSQGALNYGGGAKCGINLALAQAGQSENTITYKMNNLRNSEDNCSGSANGDGSCNTTRSREMTTLGTLDLYYTNATSFTVPTILRATINETANPDTSDANSITMVFGFNNPIVVTDKTTGMDIKINYNYALSVDFEDVIPVGGETQIDNDDAVTKRIRLLGAGPFGIAFVPNEGGSTD